MDGLDGDAASDGSTWVGCNGFLGLWLAALQKLRKKKKTQVPWRKLVILHYWYYQDLGIVLVHRSLAGDVLRIIQDRGPQYIIMNKTCLFS